MGQAKKTRDNIFPTYLAQSQQVCALAHLLQEGCLAINQLEHLRGFGFSTLVGHRLPR